MPVKARMGGAPEVGLVPVCGRSTHGAGGSWVASRVPCVTQCRVGGQAGRWGQARPSETSRLISNEHRGLFVEREQDELTGERRRGGPCHGRALAGSSKVFGEWRRLQQRGERGGQGESALTMIDVDVQMMTFICLVSHWEHSWCCGRNRVAENCAHAAPGGCWSDQIFPD